MFADHKISNIRKMVNFLSLKKIYQKRGALPVSKPVIAKFKVIKNSNIGKRFIGF